MRELQRISSWTELINQCAACRRGTGGWEKKREGGREEAKVEGTPERKRLEKMYGDLTEHVTWREKREAHTHTHTRGENTNTLPGRVIFSDPHFTVSPANNPYNLTSPRNLTDQSITPSNCGVILRSEMKHIKAQVWVCVCVFGCVYPFLHSLFLPSLPPSSPLYFLLFSTELPDCGMIQQKCKAPWMDKMAGVVFLPPLWDVTPLYVPKFFLYFPPPRSLILYFSTSPHFLCSFPPVLSPASFLPCNRTKLRGEQFSWIYSELWQRLLNPPFFFFMAAFHWLYCKSGCVEMPCVCARAGIEHCTWRCNQCE